MKNIEKWSAEVENYDEIAYELMCKGFRTLGVWCCGVMITPIVLIDFIIQHMIIIAHELKNRNYMPRDGG